jgi:hypothetical protein
VSRPEPSRDDVSRAAHLCDGVFPGVRFRTPTRSRVTDRSGRFRYLLGEPVRFLPAVSTSAARPA